MDFCHSASRSNSASLETSMKPYLDNSHVDKKNSFRIQFQGSHVLKSSRRGRLLSKQQGPPNPVYIFSTQKGTIEYGFTQSHCLPCSRLLIVPVSTIRKDGEAMQRFQIDKNCQRDSMQIRHNQYLVRTSVQKSINLLLPKQNEGDSTAGFRRVAE